MRPCRFHRGLSENGYGISEKKRMSLEIREMAITKGDPKTESQLSEMHISKHDLFPLIASEMRYARSTTGPDQMICDKEREKDLSINGEKKRDRGEKEEERKEEERKRRRKRTMKEQTKRTWRNKTVRRTVPSARTFCVRYNTVSNVDMPKEKDKNKGIKKESWAAKLCPLIQQLRKMKVRVKEV